MASERTARSPNQILSQAIRLRAEAYRRWRRAADAEPPGPRKRAYQALAAFECDRYDELLRRYLGSPAPVLESAGARLDLPHAVRTRVPLKAAAVAAEAERRTWAQYLRRAGEQSIEHGILADLIEDARRVRDLVGAGIRT